ncbi:cryptochrome/photolyase family protein [Ichthyenterobacterium sp. W332]|uniref:Cryptochrome/photolyase family protein n=1 Tax=Microcosmobacter mediterraneus TaxID=3075607 RepID=A0ABU2YHG0_9FLAO|nr:cryptochrome/photolyase family protein [Ichthyenterobacterium sp. W332]MDT0557603.1 cryptochrome/photolyase family protein [Ichthyenterobacterium sp. W332]
MKKAVLLFPHQLFKNSSLLELDVPFYLIEEYLFFNHYKFHKQKLAFHRATMTCYKDYLEEKGKTVYYIEATSELSDVRKLIPKLIEKGLEQIYVTDPTDNWLQKHIDLASKKIKVNYFDNPLFINTKNELNTFFKPEKKKFFQTSFYKQQRKTRDILMDGNVPEGGKWTYDSENRKKYPKTKTPPSIHFPDITNYYKDAVNYVKTHYSDNYGTLSSNPIYPICFDTAESWLLQFLEQRFYDFGVYEDAIVKEHTILNHSVLSPLINIGLITPQYVIERSITFAKENNIPINSLEGFVRQILGWREFIRGIYEVKGTEERNRNFWEFTRKLPKSFYDGTTGIKPIDTTIKKVLQTGYTHHIERLMILGNFMVLCEIDPDDVYQWFMELFIDAYDWVMVPNVYGMSLFADGGLMSTKPYISSSNYIMKMSDYSKGEWQDIWDGLFWTFMDKHRDFFLSNPRLGMLIRTFDKMPIEKKETHFVTAKQFFDQLDDQG